jgi:hypothetical protein
VKNAHLSVVYLHIFVFLFGFLLAAKIEEQVKILVFSVFLPIQDAALGFPDSVCFLRFAANRQKCIVCSSPLVSSFQLSGCRHMQ